MSEVCAVIVAAGSSTRMNGIDKQTALVAGKPVIARTMAVFENCPSVSEIIVVTRSDLIEKIRAVAAEYGISKLKAVVPGGQKRSESVRNGIDAVSGSVSFVAIQDGARPLVTCEEIENCISDAKKYGASIVAVPVRDTIKITSDGFVSNTPERDTLFAAQTPQIFGLSEYKDAMYRAFEELYEWTDDSMIFENAGKKVHITPGNSENIKITTPEDIEIAEAIIKRRKSE